MAGTKKCDDVGEPSAVPAGAADGGWVSDQLIRSAQEGDPESLAALVHGAHPHVRRFAERLCVSQQDAEDAAQDALITLYLKIGSLRASAALASWMFRIVRHECLRRVRTLLEIGGDADAGAGTEPVDSAEDEALRRIDAERVAAAIRQLPDVQRQVLIMRDLLGYRGRAVAQTLGMSDAAMKSHLHRARTRLRLSLSGHSAAEGAHENREPSAVTEP